MAATATPRNRTEGLAKLLAAPGGKMREAPSLEEIKRALATSRQTSNSRYRTGSSAAPHRPISNWMPLSNVQSKNLGEVVNRLVQLNDSTISLKILINGIPFPEIANIQDPQYARRAIGPE